MDEAFSLTDLFAALLDACVMTIIGMRVAGLDTDLVGACTEAVKGMATNPRHVAEVAADFYLSKDLNERNRRPLEAATHTCPVAQSPSVGLVQELRFRYE